MQGKDAHSGEPHPQITGDTVVELSAHGHALYEQLIESCSDIAGRQISIDEIIKIRDTMRDDYGTDELDFTDPEVMERFRAYLRGDRTG